ncbi:MAG: helix-turn-helix domain-containing protein, partial [Rhizobiales bacterium]|nr:helix-turn-helix domain-containing protein [Hyphomicrobiales bacterium]
MVTNKSFSLTDEERKALGHVLRQRKADGLIIRRANALLLLDKNWQPQKVADALFLDGETIRSWRRHFIKHGLGFLVLSPYSKREGHLGFTQEVALKAHLGMPPPRSTNEVRKYIQDKYHQS